MLCAYPRQTTFIKKDLEIFRVSFDVRSHAFDAKKKSLTFLRFISQTFFLLQHIWKAQIIVCEFSGYHSFLPALFGRWRKLPVLIISAGTDCVAFPSIHYGNFAKGLMGRFTKKSFQLCTHISPVHGSLIYREDTYYPETPPYQGIYHFVPGLQTAYTMIPYGFDPEKWYPKGPKEPNSFITVAYIIDERRFILKGIDMIIQVAHRFPSCTFSVVGYKYDFAGEIPANVRLIGPTPNKDILPLYQSHEFYLQLSISEGHPNAICEAMLCGCIPIGSDVTAIPDIIGDTGFIVAKRDIDSLEASIRKAIDSPKVALSSKARRRISQYYTYERRKSEMLVLLNSLIEQS